MTIKKHIIISIIILYLTEFSFNAFNLWCRSTCWYSYSFLNYLLYWF